jgi:phospholipid N-methyltransferase
MKTEKSAYEFFPRDATVPPVPGTNDFDLYLNDQLTFIDAEYIKSANKMTNVADEIFVEVGKNAVAMMNAIRPRKAVRVLDLCSGIGMATETFLEMGMQVESLTLTEQHPDLVRRAVEYTETKGFRSKIARLASAFFEPNLHKLADVAPGEYDLVVSCNAFQHFSCEVQKSLMQQVHRQLSPHGVLLVQSHWKTHEPSWRNAIMEDMKARMAATHAPAKFQESAIRHVGGYHNFVSSSDLMDWCREAGFGLVDILFRKHIIGIVGAVK